MLRRACLVVRRMGLANAVRYVAIRVLSGYRVYSNRWFKYVPCDRRGFLYYNFYDEPRTFGWLRSNYSRYDTFVNIGAGYGEYALFMASVGRRVVAYEPNPYLFAIMRLNMLLNGFNAEIYMRAVCEGEEADFVLAEIPTDSYILGYGRGGCPGRMMRVRCDDLSGLRLDGNALFLIDVEGYEENVLRLISKHHEMSEHSYIIESDDVSRLTRYFPGRRVMVLDEFGGHRNYLIV